MLAGRTASEAGMPDAPYMDADDDVQATRPRNDEFMCTMYIIIIIPVGVTLRCVRD